jgi:hypothetical protein
MERKPETDLTGVIRRQLLNRCLIRVRRERETKGLKHSLIANKDSGEGRQDVVAVHWGDFLRFRVI